MSDCDGGPVGSRGNVTLTLESGETWCVYMTEEQVEAEGFFEGEKEILLPKEYAFSRIQSYELGELYGPVRLLY